VIAIAVKNRHSARLRSRFQPHPGLTCATRVATRMHACTRLRGCIDDAIRTLRAPPGPGSSCAMSVLGPTVARSRELSHSVRLWT
jgi:hypothetical protein